MQFGTFKNQQDGTLTGVFRSLSLQSALTFRRVEKPRLKLFPDYRIFREDHPVGEGYLLREIVRNGVGHFMSVKLDDPSFPNPIYAYLVGLGRDDSFVLEWDRSNVIPFKQNLQAAG